MFGLPELKEWDMENIEEDCLHIITERLNMAFRRRRCCGSGIRMTGYTHKPNLKGAHEALTRAFQAMTGKRRGSGIRMTGYTHNPFKMFTAKRKELLDPVLKRVALAMNRAKRI